MNLGTAYQVHGGQTLLCPLLQVSLQWPLVSSKGSKEGLTPDTDRGARVRRLVEEPAAKSPRLSSRLERFQGFDEVQA